MTAITYDFTLVGPVDGSTAMSTSGTSVKDSAVAAGGSGASISPGDVVKYANGYWAKVANDEGTAAGLYGMAVTTSTETASVDGLVTVKYHPGGLKVKGRPTTPGNLAQGILGDLVSIDVSAGVQTVDENGAGILRLVDYDNSTSGNETVTVILPYNCTPA